MKDPVPGIGKFVAVVGEGKGERYVNDREEAISWAKGQGYKTVDLWVRKEEPQMVFSALCRGVVIDDSEPVEFYIPCDGNNPHGTANRDLATCAALMRLILRRIHE